MRQAQRRSLIFISRQQLNPVKRGACASTVGYYSAKIYSRLFLSRPSVVSDSPNDQVTVTSILHILMHAVFYRKIAELPINAPSYYV